MLTQKIEAFDSLELKHFDLLCKQIKEMIDLMKSENIIGLDSYILNSFSYLSPIWIYVSHCMIDYPKRICLAHILSF